MVGVGDVGRRVDPYGGDWHFIHLAKERQHITALPHQQLCCHSAKLSSSLPATSNGIPGAGFATGSSSSRPTPLQPREHDSRCEDGALQIRCEA